jgi:hypothetical protein
MRIIALCTALMAAFLFASSPVLAKSASPVGKWSGGGYIKESGKAKERVRCHVSISQISGNAFRANVRCAGAGKKVSQSTKMRRIRGNEFVGAFNSPEFGVSGTISSRIIGNKQTVRLNSDKGRGVVVLRKR